MMVVHQKVLLNTLPCTPPEPNYVLIPTIYDPMTTGGLCKISIDVTWEGL